MKKLKLFNLAWPIFIETALFMLLGTVDVFVLSRYDDLAASSVNAANQAISITTIVFTVISTASAVMISQYLGAKKEKSASRVSALSMAFHLIFGVIISCVFLLFGTPILKFIGAKGEVLRFAGEYLSIVGGFVFMQALLSSMSVIIRNHGMTKVSMYVTVGMNVINTALDVIFVLGLFGLEPMGVRGVAIATTFSRLCGVVVLAMVLFKKVEKPSIFKLLKPLPKEDIKNIVKIGVPAAMETFLYNVSQLIITSIVLNCLTEAELIAKTYLHNITMFFYIFAVSIGQASQILMGHLVGAKQYDKAQKQAYKSYGLALMVVMTVSVVGVIFRKSLMDIFTDNPQVIALGANVLFINLALELGRTSNLVLIACLRGSGDVFYPTLCAIFSNIIISTLGSYLFAVVFGMGIYGLWIAIAADECVRGVLMFLRIRSGKWKTKSLT
ncbi:MAG: MATE family efflux transporter [Ruminococcaceae bacterium]|nr:MATE family efflux transporter [Oscillospiraceae bacterium]